VGGEGGGGVGGKGRGWGKGEEMTQALYAHMNNKTIKFFLKNGVEKEYITIDSIETWRSLELKT
jgi:hypothetical protein